ncbi:MAG TPA: hydantoinase/oxoprolinase family protein [Jiangellales bacterium]|nr:hydantoinase/oxoprolinase family protein [Jiangellales bacterium]
MDARGVGLGVDVGGTFTDLVAIQDGRLVTAKVPSTPRDQSTGVIAAVDSAALEPAAVTVFAHGSTVATNALLERRGGRTALVTTSGFRDVLEIGRQNRPSLYDLTAQRPPPLVPRELRFTVRERMGPDGVVRPLDEDDLNRVVRQLVDAQVDAVAVCLLFGFLHPGHERQVGDRIRAALPDVPVSLASDLLPEFREYERTATVTADAYLAPRLAAYLGRLDDRTRDHGLTSPLVMQSSGGVIDVGTAAEHPARCVLSGPAAGVVGASYVAGLSGYRDLLTFDMGGTSTDVAPVVDGAVQTTTESVVAGVPLKLPMVDVHTVSAGGGSVAWVDEGGVLRVGPHSAGADPGPAAYGMGGTEPTVTDADLLLGCLADGTTLGGQVTLSLDRARQALQELGCRLGLSPEDAALGVARVATTEMVRALRVISIERGLDPRDFALVAFGGAGGMHACAMAEELGVRTVLLPRAAGVLSALGLALSDIRRDYVAPLLGRVDELDPETLREAWTGLARRAREELAPLGDPRTERLADLRYRGQSYELVVGGETPDELARVFHDTHQRRYGHHDAAEVVEIVGLRLVATVAGEKPDVVEPDPATRDTRTGHRRVLLEEGPVGAEVHDRSLMGRGSTVAGPAVVELAEATWLVRPGWRGSVDGVGTLVLSRQEADR